MSKESDECYTPIEIIRSLGEFDLDPACGPRCKNRTAKRRYQTHGLERKWFGRVWLNPPFSECRKWAQRFMEHGNGIMLLFLCRDNKWFKRLLLAGGVFSFLPKSRNSKNRMGRLPAICSLKSSFLLGKRITMRSDAAASPAFS